MSISRCYHLIMLLLCAIMHQESLSIRSIHRPIDPDMPEISAYWNDQSRRYIIKDPRIKKYPIFEISAKSSYPYMLPDAPITFSTHATRKVTGIALKRDLEHLLLEIKAGRTTFSQFFLLKKQGGYYILRYKHYPFVVKLSLEQPKTFIDPFCKGIVPMCFFFMAGGSNRHMTGLTRIPNLHTTNDTLAHTAWRDHVKTPRKWFWLPENCTFFHVTGKNIGPDKETLTTTLPSVYAVIADAIDTTQHIPISNKKKNTMIIKLCNDLKLTVDPHENNFVFQIDPITHKIVIIILDTENFPTMVGIKENKQFTGHVDFYASLIKKCARDIFLCSKDHYARTPYADKCTII